jgi:hypothetical protein
MTSRGLSGHWRGATVTRIIREEHAKVYENYTAAKLSAYVVHDPLRGLRIPADRRVAKQDRRLDAYRQILFGHGISGRGSRNACH